MFIVIAGPSTHEKYLYWNTGKAVVILSPLSNLRSGGSGFQILTAKGPRVITNAHICGDNLVLQARNLWRGAEQVDILRVLKVDRESDLCMLEEVPGLGVISLAFFASSILDEIFVVGHPALELTTLTRGRVRGDIQVKVRHITSTSAKIYMGSSGSPVINSFGRVVGVISEVSKLTNNGYFVPLQYLKSFIGRR